MRYKAHYYDEQREKNGSSRSEALPLCPYHTNCDLSRTFKNVTRSELSEVFLKFKKAACTVLCFCLFSVSRCIGRHVLHQCRWISHEFALIWLYFQDFTQWSVDNPLKNFKRMTDNPDLKWAVCNVTFHIRTIILVDHFCGSLWCFIIRFIESRNFSILHSLFAPVILPYFIS